MDGQRELAFERIEDVMTEVERLLVGHSTTRGWTLGQILHHLSTAIRLSLDFRGDSTPPADLQRVFEVRRRFFFRSGRFPDGAKIPHPAMQPPADADERVEAEGLRAALESLKSSDGPFATHPIIGPLSKAEWVDFHRIHCAHHLAFAIQGPPG